MPKDWPNVVYNKASLNPSAPSNLGSKPVHKPASIPTCGKKVSAVSCNCLASLAIRFAAYPPLFPNTKPLCACLAFAP